ncbi:ABC transporter ATP-binding protein [Nocardioides sp. GY 10127]|uniref:ABC transporter ATP-binding protein n=1 Tax=Nocardioides sp. GY 10127 TaxID=2569762 RepID=UPI0010A90EA3|nr:ABC transporter ATP-binding protein [Nocardioides sp. GY 10127]TIC80876.1 ABC transporter ATP-binding protein [Nocardioides sp. GY 10127]
MTLAPEAPRPGAGTAGPAISLRGLTKRYGAVTAVESLDLDVAEGEFFSMLGPSGSGKTTVLRLVAGFEEATEGTVLLGGQDVTAAPPYAREVNTVFQDYAIFPHLDVQANVEYGLRVKKVPRAERRRRAAEALETVRLDGYASRKPHELSGGQRQRVALARALVNRPRVLLLDEPLGALDLQLRREMQVELKQIQRDVGITFVFVTHDQEEALTMSDRIAVFNQGRIEQLATPHELYERPASAFVAGFVGTSNLLEGDVARTLVGESGPFVVRPEKVRLGEPAEGLEPGWCAGEGTVLEVVYLGATTHTVVRLDAGVRMTVADHNDETVAAPSGDPANGAAHARRDQRVRLSWRRDHLVPLAGTAHEEESR